LLGKALETKIENELKHPPAYPPRRSGSPGRDVRAKTSASVGRQPDGASSVRF
jgi:hypothetical protein